MTKKIQHLILSTVLVCLTCPINTFGQETIHEFRQHLNQFNSDKEKFQAILQYEKDRNEEIDKEYSKILENTIDYYNKSGKPKATLPLVNTLTQYYIFGNNVDHEKAREILNKAQAHSRTLPIDSSFMDFHVLSGELNIFESHPSEAINDFQTVIDRSREIGDTLHSNFGYAHLKLAEIYLSEWNIIQSDKYFHLAGEFFLKTQDTTMYLWALSGQSTLYSNNRLYHDAEVVRQEIFKIGLESNRLQIVAIAHLSAAIEYKIREIDRLRQYHLNQAMQYINFPSDVREYIKTITFALFTQYFADQNNVDSTEYYMDEFRSFYHPEQHGPWIGEYYRLAESYLALVHHKYVRARDLVWKLIDDAKSKNKLTNLTRLYGMMVDIYIRSGDKPKAFETLVTYNQFKDSLESIQFNNQFLYYNQLFAAEKRDKQILQQKNSIELLSEKNKVLFWRALLAILCIIILFLIVFIVRSYQYSVQKSALQRSFSQNLIQQQEKERARISQELHDGISQELILVKNKLDREQNIEAASLVAGSLSQLRHVSRSLYPVILKNFGLKLALEQLLNKVGRATPDMEVHYDISDCEDRFSKQEKLHIYRIIQEAINNVIKYAHCSQLTIFLKEKKHYILLSIEDNGIGFDSHNRSIPQEGIGLNSMEERTKMLGGSFQLKSTVGGGTRIEIIIPNK